LVEPKDSTLYLLAFNGHIIKYIYKNSDISQANNRAHFLYTLIFSGENTRKVARLYTKMILYIIAWQIMCRGDHTDILIMLVCKDFSQYNPNPSEQA